MLLLRKFLTTKAVYLLAATVFLFACDQADTQSMALAAESAVDTTEVDTTIEGGEEYADILAKFTNVDVTAIKPSVVPGLLELYSGAEVYYVTDDGAYFMQAEIVDMETRANVTEESRIQARQSFMDGFDYSRTVTFAADDEQYRVLVFTDIDCGYCRKLHRQIAEYNELGITIQYAFFPRSGPNTESWTKAEQVWCASSRAEALTSAKQNESFETEECDDTPVAAHYALVNQLGLRGTPSLFTSNGTLHMGYLTPDQLLELLELEAAEAG